MNLGPLSDMTRDEILNRRAEWHGKGASEREKQRILQSMLDDLDGIPLLKREVLTSHLVPRKISKDELKRDVLVPVLLFAYVWSFCAAVFL